MIPARGPQTMFSVSLKVNNLCNAICAMQSRNTHANVYTYIDTHTYKYPQMCLLNFCATCCKAWTRSIHSWAYAHKHMLCSSVTKSLREAASVCIASDAL